MRFMRMEALDERFELHGCPRKLSKKSMGHTVKRLLHINKRKL